MATVVTFNIAGATATWDTQAAGAGLVFAADKEDTGTERTVDEQSEYVGEVWGNSVDTAFDQINEVFNGTRTATALAVGGAVAADAASGSGDFVVGDGGSTGHGMTILSSDFCRLHLGSTADNDAGRLVYGISSALLSFYTGGGERLRLDVNNLRGAADNDIDLGRTSTRFGNVYSYDGDFADDVTVGGDLLCSDFSGSPVQQYQKADAGSTFVYFYNADATASDGDHRLFHDTVESFGQQSYYSSAWNNVWRVFPNTSDVTFYGDLEMGLGGPRVIAGSGDPEGSVTADVGSIYMRTDGGSGTSVYAKESGTGNTGWSAL